MIWRIWCLEYRSLLGLYEGLASAVLSCSSTPLRFRCNPQDNVQIYLQVTAVERGVNFLKFVFVSSELSRYSSQARVEAGAVAHIGIPFSTDKQGQSIGRSWGTSAIRFPFLSCLFFSFLFNFISWQIVV